MLGVTLNPEPLGVLNEMWPLRNKIYKAGINKDNQRNG